MMPLAPLRTSLGGVRPHTRQVFAEIADRWPIYFAWGIGATGEHKQGRAIDFMTYADGTVKAPGPIRVQVGKDIAAYLWANHTRLGIWYVIHRQQIISVNSNSYGPAGQWHGMADRGDPTANHMDHVHVSFLDSPPAYQPPAAPAAPVVTPAAEQVARFPGAAWFRSEPRHALITEMGKRLVAVGCGRYQQGPGPQWSDADRQSYKAWQEKLGYSGADADGWPGPDSWAKLQVPNPAYKPPTPSPAPAPKPVPDGEPKEPLMPGTPARLVRVPGQAAIYVIDLLGRAWHIEDSPHINQGRLGGYYANNGQPYPIDAAELERIRVKETA